MEYLLFLNPNLAWYQRSSDAQVPSHRPLCCRNHTHTSINKPIIPLLPSLLSGAQSLELPPQPLPGQETVCLCFWALNRATDLQRRIFLSFFAPYQQATLCHIWEKTEYVWKQFSAYNKNKWILKHPYYLLWTDFQIYTSHGYPKISWSYKLGRSLRFPFSRPNLKGAKYVSSWPPKSMWVMESGELRLERTTWDGGKHRAQSKSSGRKIIYSGLPGRVPIYFCFLVLLPAAVPFYSPKCLVWTPVKYIVIPGTRQTGNDLCTLEPKICGIGGNGHAGAAGIKPGQLAPELNWEKGVRGQQLPIWKLRRPGWSLQIPPALNWKRAAGRGACHRAHAGPHVPHSSQAQASRSPSPGSDTASHQSIKWLKSQSLIWHREGRPCFFWQVMPTVSGFSPVFSTLRLAPVEQAEADCEGGWVLQDPLYPTWLSGAPGSLSLLSSAHWVCTSQL